LIIEKLKFPLNKHIEKAVKGEGSRLLYLQSVVTTITVSEEMFQSFDVFNFNICDYDQMKETDREKLKKIENCHWKLNKGLKKFFGGKE